VFGKRGGEIAGSQKETRTAGDEAEGQGLAVLRPNVAGIDLASEIHWVCAPNVDGTGREVEKFGATTPELERMAEWLKQRQVESVAMENTGVYWIAPYEVLERYEFEILLVDTRELARVPGRKKSDHVDCKWIQRLHSCGLLRGSFRPAEQVCRIRTLVRDRGNLVAAADWLRRMQKSLDQMNVRVHRAVNDIEGATGMAIIRAIVKGERRPEVGGIARCALPEERGTNRRTIERTLSGGPPIQLTGSAADVRCGAERDCRLRPEILRQLAAMEREECRGQQAPKLKNVNKAQKIKSRGEQTMRQALYRMSGVDATAIDTIGVGTVQVILSEYGPDLSRFATEKQFVQHATLAPHQPTSGGKKLKKEETG